MQILSIKLIYAINTQFLTMKPIYIVQTPLFAINLLAKIIFIDINYLFLVDSHR